MGLFVNRTEGVGAGIDFTDPNSALAPYYLRFGHVLGAAVMAAVFYWLSFASLWHTDIWGHLKFGEYLLRERHFPTGEHFCPFAEKDVATVNYTWLSQASFALIYRLGAWLVGGDAAHRLAGGADALRAFHALLVTVWLALLWVAFHRRTKSATLAALGIATIVLIRFGNLGIARPQVIAEAIAAAMLVLVSAPNPTRLALAGLPPLMIVWANAHGSYLIGLALLGGLTAGRAVEVFFGPSPRLANLAGDQRFLGWLFVTIASLVGIAIANPEGPSIFAKTLEMARQPNVRAMDEWQPITSSFATVARITYVVCLATIAGGLACTRLRARGEFWVILVLFGVPPILHQRALVWFITFAPWLSLPLYATLLAARRPDWWSSVPSFKKTMVVGFLVVAALTVSVPAQNLIARQPSPLPIALSDGTPWRYALAIRDPELTAGDEGLVRHLRAAYPDGKYTGTVFASETLGDFFLWESSPPHPVFIYSHVHLFGETHWKRCTQVRSAGPGWREILDWSRANLIVVEAEQNPRLCQQLRTDTEWLVLADETGDTSKRNLRNRLFAAVRKRPK